MIDILSEKKNMGKDFCRVRNFGKVTQKIHSCVVKWKPEDKQ